MLKFLYTLIISLLFLSLFGYVLATLREKMYIKQNIIVIPNRHLTRNDLEEIDINEFKLRGKSAKTGDEIKIITSEKERLRGILIGANRSNQVIHIITFKNKIKKLKVDNIMKFKVTSKYGKFLNY